MAPVRTVAVVLALIVAYWPANAQAAVRRCLASIERTGEAATDAAAKQLAVGAWIAQATQAGESYAAWRLAWGKDLSCTALATGGVRCRAIGQPCRIDQLPTR